MNPVIVSVIHHRQNRLDSVCIREFIAEIRNWFGIVSSDINGVKHFGYATKELIGMSDFM
jgi:hypothetical protein